VAVSVTGKGCETVSSKDRQAFVWGGEMSLRHYNALNEYWQQAWRSEFTLDHTMQKIIANNNTFENENALTKEYRTPKDGLIYTLSKTCDFLSEAEVKECIESLYSWHLERLK
jgi:hypothetical protein